MNVGVKQTGRVCGVGLRGEAEGAGPRHERAARARFQAVQARGGARRAAGARRDGVARARGRLPAPPAPRRREGGAARNEGKLATIETIFPCI